MEILFVFIFFNGGKYRNILHIAFFYIRKMDMGRSDPQKGGTPPTVYEVNRGVPPPLHTTGYPGGYTDVRYYVGGVLHTQ